MAQLPSPIISHSAKVCRLYKKAVRCLESYYYKKHEFRYEAVLLRERFDKNANIKNLIEAKELLRQGEEEVFKFKHFEPKVFPDSPEGILYEREFEHPDWLLDHWSPIEKAAYPKYFARREERKKEYIENYNKEFPNAKRNFDDD